MVKRKHFAAVFLVCLAAAMVPAGCAGKGAEKEQEKNTAGSENKERKDYDLPVSGKERKRAEKECLEAMGFCRDIYRKAEKGETDNTVLSRTAIKEMMRAAAEGTKAPSAAFRQDAGMENAGKMEAFLSEISGKKKAEIVLFRIRNDGGIARYRFYSDGNTLYLEHTNSFWNDKGKAVAEETKCAKIETWQYTENGWFCYTVSTPKPPAVTEVVDGSDMLRVKARPEAYAKLEEDCLYPVGYQGSNLFLTDWDAKNIGNLDFPGTYDGLYSIMTGKEIREGRYPEGIPEEEYEKVITAFLPVTADDLRQRENYRKQDKTYAWLPKSFHNYTEGKLGNAIPEIREIADNGDGTFRWRIDAVGISAGSDSMFTHELTVEEKEDGDYRYLANKVIKDMGNYAEGYRFRMTGK